MAFQGTITLLKIASDKQNVKDALAEVGFTFKEYCFIPQLISYNPKKNAYLLLKLFNKF